MFKLRAMHRILQAPYFFQPLQLCKRLQRELFWKNRTEAVIRLPWGLPIRVNPHEAIGSNIARQGIYELAVTETLWRLTDNADLAVDVGANFGYMASIFGVRVGPRGRVLCFEPHPGIIESLKQNVKSWQCTHKCGEFDIRQMALGESNGRAYLHWGDWFGTNRGTSWVSALEDGGQDKEVCEISICTLDGLFPKQRLGIVKIDVEGGGLSVLRGMAKLLDRRGVRDIVLEEVGQYPAPTHKFLKDFGYCIFGLEARFGGVSLLSDTAPSYNREIGPPPNYLATLDANRAVDRLKSSPWLSFGLGKMFRLPD
jgi:FkbM family methyltransferase